MYTYFVNNSFTINSISINCSDKTYELPTENIQQRFKKTLDQNEILACDTLHSLFENAGISHKLNTALSYLVIGLETNENVGSFDNLWRSFNGLAKMATSKSKDSEVLRELRDVIEQKYDEFELLNEFAGKLTTDYLEKRYISEYIKNEYKDIKNLCGFNRMKEHMLLSFTDFRVCTVIIQRMNCKKRELKLYDPNNNIDKELDKRILNRNVDNFDVVRLLILKYSYFLRCKYFHGEKIPENFLVNTIESKELTYMSIPLKLMIFDILNTKTYIQKR